MRQAQKAPNLTKETILNVNPQDLSRYNRSYEVFKTMRGTSMYFEEAKKNVMATLRQNGSPSLFLTLSCAEYSWTELLKEIFETVEGREATPEDINNLTPQERNKLISENVVQSTLHFQKRIEKEIKLMTFLKFFDDDCPYSVSSYFYRIEFQQRGSPHVHCLLWLKDKDGTPAPTFWSSADDQENEESNKIKVIESIAQLLISASLNSALCDDHHNMLRNTRKASEDGTVCKLCFSAKSDFVECENHKRPVIDNDECPTCTSLKELVKRCQTHNHTFTCKKKRKAMTIRANEGQGRNDGRIKANKISDYVVCRFNFPQFPLPQTVFIKGMSKDLTDEQVKQRKADYRKIKKFLIRQTTTENNEETEELKSFNEMTFLQYLFEVGMFENDKPIEKLTESEKDEAYRRYLNALSVSVRGTGSVFLQRLTKDIFTNNFNRRLLGVHKANHDLQIVVDQVCFIISISNISFYFSFSMLVLNMSLAI